MAGPQVNWDGLTVLITGGTGSFGTAFTQLLLREPVKVVRILSRDELKQSEAPQDERIRYLIGDVRSRDRLMRAFDGVDVVVHAAAMKQVPACEYNPWEAIQTNIIGTMNVIDAAIERGVSRVIAISTDKAAHPVNLYGATKLCAEKLIAAAKSFAGARPTRFAVVRYGNVVGSRGSIVPLLMRQRETGIVTLTDERMSRFWLTLDRAVTFTKLCIESMHGGEVFVPKIPSVKLLDIARAIAPDCNIEWIGLRQGEKLHETLITSDEVPNAQEHSSWFCLKLGGRGLYANAPYTSDTNDHWLSVEEIAESCSGHPSTPTSSPTLEPTTTGI